MSDGGPDRRNPLGPYFPAEVPDIPGRGRRWVAILLVVMLLFGAVFWVIAYVVSSVP